MLGIKEEHISALYQIYDEAFGARARPPRFDHVQEDLKDAGFFDYRAGSRWSPNSKFLINCGTVQFSPSYSPKDEVEQQEMDAARKQFDERVDNYMRIIESEARSNTEPQ